ncbi:FtsX-like permease family protein [Streptomyces sp. NPDC004232]|uniref:FtsX-like permease family protein n=1 Tax=Streptomyces sp. NPDC004232 TaxID=3154454 RepID=UPI0033B23743
MTTPASGLVSATVRRIGQRPSRLLLTGCTLIVTAFFLTASTVFTATLKRQLGDTLSTVAAGTSVVVGTDGEHLLDDARLARLTSLPGVTEAQPVARGEALVEGAGRDPYPLIGTALTGPQAIVRPVRGTLPERPGEVAVTKAMGERRGLGVGSRITLVPQESWLTSATRHRAPRTVTITAVVQAPQALATGVFTTPSNARTWLGTKGWQQALLRAGDRPAAEVKAMAGKELGAGFTTWTGAEIRTKGSERGSVGALSTLLTAFVVVALLAGTVIVSTTFRVLLARDQKRLALLRCIGARPAQVMRSVLTEAALAGLVAGVLGVGAAVGCAAAVTALSGLPGPQLPVPTLFGCVLVSVLAAVGAATPAAWAAARVAPVTALSSAATRNAPDRTGRVRTLTGVLCLAAALLLGTAAEFGGGADSGAAAIGSVASGIALFGCFLALGPTLLRATVRVAHRPVRAVAGLDGALALRNLGRAGRRSAACAVVLMLGISMVAAVLVTLTSVQNGMDRRLAARDPADVVIDVPRTGKSALTADVVRDVRALPETGAVVPVTVGDGSAAGPRGRYRDYEIHGIDPSAVPELLTGTVPVRGTLRPGQASLSTTTAAALGVRTGERISVRTADGKTISAQAARIHPANNPALGDIALLPQDFAKLAPHASVRSLYVNATDRADPASLRGPLDRVLPLDPALHLTYTGEDRITTRQSIGDLRIMALGLVGITVLVSLVGVAVTLTLSVMERARENGVLRAVGMRGSRLRSVLAWEAGLLGLYAAVPGTALGALYGTLLLGALPDLSIPTIPYGQLTLTVAVALILALAASVLPASRTATTSPMLALQAD